MDQLVHRPIFKRMAEALDVTLVDSDDQAIRICR